LAAAALIVAGVAVGISHAGGSNTSHSSASRSASAAPKATPVNGAPQGLGAVPQAPMVTASLGSIQSPQALAAAVRGVLGTGTAAGGIGAGVASGSGASGATPASAAAGCSVAPSRFPPGSQPVLLLQTAAVYRSVPAQVFAYRVGTGRVAFVLADHNCALLAQVPL
jgi:hypothetical protein